MSVNMLQTRAAFPAHAQAGSRSLFRNPPSFSPRSVCVDDGLSRGWDLVHNDRHQRRGCRAPAVAAWAPAPLSWLKNQMSKEMWAHVTSSLSTLAAFVICMALSVMIGTVLCIWRFYVRETRRHMAQADRREERVQWTRRRVQRALVLSQDISELLPEENHVNAREVVRAMQMAQHHARSLACSASSALSKRHVSGRVLSASFRDFTADNWRLKATGKKLYKTVHQRSEPLPVAHESPDIELKRLQQVELQAIQDFYTWSAPKAGESDFERVKRMRKLTGTAEQADQLATDVA